MKKIDLHIHTVSTFSDSLFTFNLDTLKRYVNDAGLNAIAITNHDLFDRTQFEDIQNALDIVVFPGIEVNVEKGHILVIADHSNLDDFDMKSKVISRKNTRVGDSISVDEFLAIFEDLTDYLIIPHYDKSPTLSSEALVKLKPYIEAGEVDSAKKFVRNVKDQAKLTPVIFSDARMRDGLFKFPVRQTFIDCGSISLNALKGCFRDKSKVALSPKDGNELVAIFNNGQQISTGLNVLLGARSSGKTHTLNKIYESIDNVKYIKQFMLVQHEQIEDERDFHGDIERQHSVFVDGYLSGFKSVLDHVKNINISANERAVERYIDTLLRSAEDLERNDAFSNARLFSEVDFPISNLLTLNQLIESVKNVIENIEYRSVIETHIELASLKELACNLIELVRHRSAESQRMRFVNDLVRDIKDALKIRTSATQVEDIDLYKVQMDLCSVNRFVEIVNFLKAEVVIKEDSIQGFKSKVVKRSFSGAGEIRKVAGLKVAFSEAFAKYDDPYEYLRSLLTIDGVLESELYRLFIKVDYKILNRDGYELSGGERSEFRLLQEIKDAQNYDLLLIDEPEASFDNMFLSSDVNDILKTISKMMPVVVVTHNSTVGASVGADYLLHTRKDYENGSVVYRIYSGYPTDKDLFSPDGSSIETYLVMMNSLEAGSAIYEGRKKIYETVKD